MLAEFEGAKAIEAVKAVAAIPTGGTGDVKYHYGTGARSPATVPRSRSGCTPTRATSSSWIPW